VGEGSALRSAGGCRAKYCHPNGLAALRLCCSVSSVRESLAWSLQAVHGFLRARSGAVSACWRGIALALYIHTWGGTTGTQSHRRPRLRRRAMKLFPSQCPPASLCGASRQLCADPALAQPPAHSLSLRRGCPCGGSAGPICRRCSALIDRPTRHPITDLSPANTYVLCPSARLPRLYTYYYACAEGYQFCGLVNPGAA
jgi:hypothetical protein